MLRRRGLCGSLTGLGRLAGRGVPVPSNLRTRFLGVVRSPDRCSARDDLPSVSASFRLEAPESAKSSRAMIRRRPRTHRREPSWASSAEVLGVRWLCPLPPTLVSPAVAMRLPAQELQEKGARSPDRRSIRRPADENGADESGTSVLPPLDRRTPPSYTPSTGATIGLFPTARVQSITRERAATRAWLPTRLGPAEPPRSARPARRPRETSARVPAARPSHGRG